jgi:hypothetical protein
MSFCCGETSPNLRCSGVQQSKSLQVLIDSGADGSFLDATLASELNIPIQPIPSTSENHSKTIQFLLIKSPQIPVVLGFSWLQQCNPLIHWSTGAIMGWSPFCHAHCLKSAQPAPERLPGASEVVPDLSAIPAEYQDLLEVFSKSQATSLLLHRLYDCGIDLLPSTTLPREHLYSLSGPETKAMEDYIEDYIGDSLATGFIRPSSSPTGAGFFFVKKKGKTLCLCIDNGDSLAFKTCYLLPVISSALEAFQGATVFFKLDLRNTYHLVWIREGDKWKTAFNMARGHRYL